MKKIEEFDNYGIDLSRSAQHKTHPGGCYSILMVIVTITIVGFQFISYFTQKDTIIMNNIFSFNEFPIAPVNFTGLKITGNIYLTIKPESITDLMRYFKIVFEYQEDAEGQTKMMIVNCAIEEKACRFEIPLEDEYFMHHSMNLNPSFGIENCKKLKQLIQPSDPSYPLLKDCADNFDEIYDQPYIQNTFLFFDYSISHFQISPLGELQQTPQSERVAFGIKKNTEHHYISELNLINIYYENTLLSYDFHNETYSNWLSPRLTDPIKEEDYNLRVIFSVRFKEDVIYYKLTKDSFFMTLVNLGGLLKLLSLIYLVPNIWNEYYMQKALFQVKELYKDDDGGGNGNGDGGGDGDKDKPKESEEEKLDIDWGKISFCKWYWLTCCCNCSAKKKLIKKKYKQLLEEYQCRSYIRPDSKSKWFDISKLMLEEDSEINDLLRDSVAIQPDIGEKEIKLPQAYDKGEEEEKVLTTTQDNDKDIDQEDKE